MIVHFKGENRMEKKSYISHLKQQQQQKKIE